MSVNVGHIFVRHRDLDAVLKVVVAYLQAFVKHHHSVGLPDGRFRKDGKRSILILPPVRGWIALLELDSRHSDLGLAGMLSQALQCRAIGLEVQGCVFNYKWGLMENGEHRQGEVLLTDEDENSALLPDFKDAELLAWELGIQQGIPASLLFLRQQDVQGSEEEGAPQAILAEISPHGEDHRFQAWKQSIRMPLEPTQPRVYLDQAFTDSASGDIRVVLESRFLWGEPKPERLERFTHLLRRIQRRYSRATSLPLEKIRFMIMAGANRKSVIALPADLGSSDGATPPAAPPNTPPPPVPKPALPPRQTGKDPFAF
ncbi:MAG: hypothetical protein HS116_11200 [Planctomycetes bacterium]|nr:hypothetical protein [Planctomycetota bacterium]